MNPIVLKIRHTAKSSTVFSDLSVGWGFCTKPDSKNISTIVTSLMYCREVLTRSFYEHVTYGSHRGIDRNNLRVIARIILPSTFVSSNVNRKMEINKFFSGLEVGLRIVNILEKRHKWSPTKIYDTVHNINEDLVTRMFVGSKRWIRSPHMLSLFCLIIRCARNNTTLFSRAKDFNSLDKLIKSFAENTRGPSSDRDYMQAVWPYVDKLMTNYSKLFKGVKFSETWSARRNRYYYLEGIYQLCCRQTHDSKLDERFCRHVAKTES